jgi:hypothetical protein
MSARFFSVLTLLTAAYAASAQRTAPGADTLLKGGNTIEVIQAYTPKVKQSPKPEWVPQLPPVDTSHPVINYDVPQQTLYYTYNSLPLNPLALGKAPFALPFPNYIKAGGGNLSTIFLDAGIGGISGQNYETAIHLHHLSQSGTIVNQKSSLSGIEADGTLHKTKSDWHAAIIGERNKYHYYGYNHYLHDYSADTVAQTYTTFRAIIDVKNTDSAGSRFNYHPAINASVYTAKVNTSETNLSFIAPFSYAVDPAIDLEANFKGALTRFNNDVQSVTNSYVGAWPGINVHGTHMGGHALLGLALGMEQTGYILPDLTGYYRANGNKFIISAGWQASLRQNTFEQLTSENPYMMNTYPVLQTRRDEVFGQFEGRGGDHFTFSGRVSWWSFTDLPVFLNDLGDLRQFYVGYQDVKAISFKAAARYTVANLWSVGGAADLYNFYDIKSVTIDDRYVWEEPALRLKGDFEITPLRKLNCGAYLSILGGIHAKDKDNGIVTLPTIVDAGVNAEYQIVPRLSVFAQINNLFNNKYQRWYGYEVYGLNIYGGLRLKF